MGFTILSLVLMMVRGRAVALPGRRTITVWLGLWVFESLKKRRIGFCPGP